jgi:hypothetical protein
MAQIIESKKFIGAQKLIIQRFFDRPTVTVAKDQYGQIKSIGLL